MNPIFIEYYSHEGCDCYKICLPWPKFAEEKIVLCKVRDGIGVARTIAVRVLTKHVIDALNRPLDKME